MGKLPSDLTAEQQKELLSPLFKILQRAGVSATFAEDTIILHGKRGSRRLVVYPAMCAKPKMPETVFISDAQIKYAKPIALKNIVEAI